MLGQKFNGKSITLGKKNLVGDRLGSKYLSRHRKPFNTEGLDDGMKQQKEFKSYLEKRN